MSMTPFLRRLLLLVLGLFLFAQIGAQVHAGSHHEHHHETPSEGSGTELVCEQCLAYSPLGAGVINTLPNWHVSMPQLAFETTLRTDYLNRFRQNYQSRAPPLTC